MCVCVCVCVCCTHTKVLEDVKTAVPDNQLPPFTDANIAERGRLGDSHYPHSGLLLPFPRPGHKRAAHRVKSHQHHAGVALMHLCFGGHCLITLYLEGSSSRYIISRSKLWHTKKHGEQSRCKA